MLGEDVEFVRLMTAIESPAGDVEFVQKLCNQLAERGPNITMGALTMMAMVVENSEGENSDLVRINAVKMASMLACALRGMDGVNTNDAIIAFATIGRCAEDLDKSEVGLFLRNIGVCWRDIQGRAMAVRKQPASIIAFPQRS